MIEQKTRKEFQYSMFKRHIKFFIPFASVTSVLIYLLYYYAHKT